VGCYCTTETSKYLYSSLLQLSFEKNFLHAILDSFQNIFVWQTTRIFVSALKLLHQPWAFPGWGKKVWMILWRWHKQQIIQTHRRNLIILTTKNKIEFLIELFSIWFLIIVYADLFSQTAGAGEHTQSEVVIRGWSSWSDPIKTGISYHPRHSAQYTPSLCKLNCTRTSLITRKIAMVNTGICTALCRDITFRCWQSEFHWLHVLQSHTLLSNTATMSNNQVCASY